MGKILLHNSEEICHIMEKRLAISERLFYNGYIAAKQMCGYARRKMT